MHRRLRNLFSSRGYKPFDAEYYNDAYGCYNFDVSPETHFLDMGMAHGFKPRQSFDPLVYAMLNPAIRPDTAFTHALMQEDSDDYSLHRALSQLPREILDYASTPIQGSSKRLKEKSAFTDPAPADPQEMAAAYRAPVDGTPEAARYWISAPSGEEFLELIERKSPFCYIKLPHGFWDRIVWINNLSEKLRRLPNTRRFSPDQIQLFATRLLGELQPDFRKQLFLSDAFVQDVLRQLKSVQSEENIFFGLAMTGFPTKSGIANDVRSFFKLDDERAHALRSAFPNGYTFWDGTLLKRLAICGALRQLPKLIKHRHTLFILSDIFLGIGDDWSLSHSEHLTIPRQNSHAIRHTLLRDATKRLERMSQKDQSPIVLAQAGGALTFWLLSHLQKKFPQATFIDVGQSIDIWRFSADVAERPWFRVNAEAIVENNPEMCFAIQNQ